MTRQDEDGFHELLGDLAVAVNEPPQVSREVAELVRDLGSALFKVFIHLRWDIVRDGKVDVTQSDSVPIVRGALSDDELPNWTEHLQLATGPHVD